MTVRLAVVMASLSGLCLSLSGTVYHQRVVAGLERQARDIRAEYDAFRCRLIQQTAETLQRNAGAVDTALAIREKQHADLRNAGSRARERLRELEAPEGAGLHTPLPARISDELVRLFHTASTARAGSAGDSASPRAVRGQNPAPAPGPHDRPNPCRLDSGTACDLR